MKSSISPFKANTTHIKLDILGSHSVEGWWVVNGQPQLNKYVVVECHELTQDSQAMETAWLLKHGAKMVQVIQVPRPEVVEDATKV